MLLTSEKRAREKEQEFSEGTIVYCCYNASDGRNSFVSWTFPNIKGNYKRIKTRCIKLQGVPITSFHPATVFLIFFFFISFSTKCASLQTASSLTFIFCFLPDLCWKPPPHEPYKQYYTIWIFYI